jgi:hypothetical protein
VISQAPARRRDFESTVALRAKNAPAFARALLQETVVLFVNGEPQSVKLILRDLVNATGASSFQREPAVCGTARMVVWEDGGGNPALPSRSWNPRVTRGSSASCARFRARLPAESRLIDAAPRFGGFPCIDSSAQ